SINFFFSSRRRHTRSKRDWSSDVCSSDLFGLRNVPDYNQVIQEMYRVVKPGGKVVCLETSQPTLIGYRQLYLLYFRFIMPLFGRSEEHTSELQSRFDLVCRHLLEKKKLKI